MYLICGIYFVCLMLYEYIANKKNDALLAISCAFIAILVSVRYQIGTDYNAYYSMFHRLLQDPSSCPRIEIGWRYITHFLSYMGFNEYGCFAFWGTLTISLVYYGLKKHASYPLISCGFFFLGYTIGGTFNSMRQMVVCAIVIAGLGVIKNQKHVQAICLFLIALSIHNVAILLPPLYLLAIYDPIFGKHKYWIVVIALLLGIGGYVGSLLLASTYFMPSERFAIIVKYYLSDENFVTEWGVAPIIKRFLLVLCVLYFLEKMSKKWEYARVAIPLYFWGNVLAFTLLSSFEISSRICMLVKILDVLILPSFLLVSEDSTWKRMIILILIAWGLFVFYRGIMVTPGVYPYKSIFGPA